MFLSFFSNTNRGAKIILLFALLTMTINLFYSIYSVLSILFCPPLFCSILFYMFCSDLFYSISSIRLYSLVFTETFRTHLQTCSRCCEITSDLLNCVINDVISLKVSTFTDTKIHSSISVLTNHTFKHVSPPFIFFFPFLFSVFFHGYFPLLITFLYWDDTFLNEIQNMLIVASHTVEEKCKK